MVCLSEISLPKVSITSVSTHQMGFNTRMGNGKGDNGVFSAGL